MALGDEFLRQFGDVVNKVDDEERAAAELARQEALDRERQDHVRQEAEQFYILDVDKTVAMGFFAASLLVTTLVEPAKTEYQKYREQQRPDRVRPRVPAVWDVAVQRLHTITALETSGGDSRGQTTQSVTRSLNAFLTIDQDRGLLVSVGAAREILPAAEYGLPISLGSLRERFAANWSTNRLSSIRDDVSDFPVRQANIPSESKAEQKLQEDIVRLLKSKELI